MRGIASGHVCARGQVRFGVGDEEFVAGPATGSGSPRGVPHSFKVESEGTRALLVFTPGGIERMFQEGGVPAGESAEPPRQEEYDVELAIALSKKFGFEVVGPQVGNDGLAGSEDRAHAPA
jgi:hypothetical protein